MTTMADLRAIMARLDDQHDPDRRLRSVYAAGVRDGVAAGVEAQHGLAFVPGPIRQLGEAELAAVLRDVVEALR